VYRLLAIDIDGTLVNSRNELTPATRAALTRAGKAGIRVVLATGRRYSHALPLVEPLGIDVPLVTASGALVKDPLDHRTLYQARFEPQALLDAVAIVDRAGFDPVLCADTFAEGFDYYHACQEARTPELTYYLTANADRSRLWPKLLQEPPPGVFGGFAVGTLEQMIELEAALHRELPGKLHTHVLHPPKYIGFFTEISPAGVTKWSAIRRLAQNWGIADSEICAVGDDVNDIPMIRAAGLGVAMGNALPAVKAAADRVAPSHDDDGLVEVVEWLLEGRR
jgi:5-amino-6-(5-phospho-D-ribitylamino)uracil phosphatase